MIIFDHDILDSMQNISSMLAKSTKSRCLFQLLCLRVSRLGLWRANSGFESARRCQIFSMPRNNSVTSQACSTSMPFCGTMNFGLVTLLREAAICRLVWTKSPVQFSVLGVEVPDHQSKGPKHLIDTWPLMCWKCWRRLWFVLPFFFSCQDLTAAVIRLLFLLSLLNQV